MRATAGIERTSVRWRALEVAFCASVLCGIGCGDDVSAEPSDDREDSGAGDAAAGGDGGNEDDHDPDAALDETSGDAGVSSDAGSDAAMDADVTEPTSLTEYCDQAGTLYFDYLQACYGEESYDDDQRESFVERITGRCLNAERAVEDGRLSYDGQQATRCVASMRADDCVGFFAEGEACRGVFAGLIELGDDCYIEESLVFVVGAQSCAEGYCEQGDRCPGTCRQYAAREESCESAQCGPEDECDATDATCRARALEGDACEDVTCAEGLQCEELPELTCVEPARNLGDACDADTPCATLGVCIDGRCAERSEEAGPCTIGVQCPDGMVCDRDPLGDDRICLPPGDEDAPCASSRQCEPPLVCLGATEDESGLCGENPAVLGQPCDQGACAEGLYCSYAVDAEGECAMRVGEGEECLTLGLPESAACVDGLQCTEAGTCAPPGELGEPCNVFDHQSCEAGLWCSRETLVCEAPAGADEPCNPFWPQTCDEGLGCACGALDRDLCGGTTREPSATDTCKPRLADGADCFRGSECESLDCNIDFEANTSEPGQCVSPMPACLP